MRNMSQRLVDRLAGGLLVSAVVLAVALLSHHLSPGPRSALGGPSQEVRPAHTPLRGQAAAVTAYVRDVLSAQVLAMEGALVATDDQIGAYHAAFTAGAVVGSLDLYPLIAKTVAVMTRQSLACIALSHDVVAPSSLQLGEVVEMQLTALREDLALFSAQIAIVMQETGADVAGMQRFLESPRAMAYRARVAEALPILRRAEDWLETVNRETGARATLPGFALGAPSLESMLATQ
jgi:hypothetical protein